MAEVVKYVGPEGLRVVVQVPDPEPAKKPAKKKAESKKKK